MSTTGSKAFVPKLLPARVLGLAPAADLGNLPASWNVKDDPALVGLAQDVENAVVKANSSGHLTIHKYRRNTVITRNWTEAALRARGLILDKDGNVKARGFNKFFNLGDIEHLLDADQLGSSHAVRMDKMDGSLGVAWREGGLWRVSTIGKLTSAEGALATKLMNERYADFDPPAGVSTMVEIISPKFPIVTNYGGMEDLVLLGGVDLSGGWIRPDLMADFGWSGPVVGLVEGPFKDLVENLPDGLPDDFEGWVFWVQDINTLVKVKCETYLDMHRVRFKLTRREVYRWLRDGVFEERLGYLPDEFMPLALEHRQLMVDEVDGLLKYGRELIDQVGTDDMRVLNTAESLTLTQRKLAMLVAGNWAEHRVFVTLLRKLDINKPGSYLAKVKGERK